MEAKSDGALQEVVKTDTPSGAEMREVVNAIVDIDALLRERLSRELGGSILGLEKRDAIEKTIMEELAGKGVGLVRREHADRPIDKCADCGETYGSGRTELIRTREVSAEAGKNPHVSTEPGKPIITSLGKAMEWELQRKGGGANSFSIPASVRHGMKKHDRYEARFEEAINPQVIRTSRIDPGALQSFIQRNK